MADKATAGVLVTSSYFSKPALEFEEKVKSQLSLHDYYDLKKWIDVDKTKNLNWSFVRLKLNLHENKINNTHTYLWAVY